MPHAHATTASPIAAAHAQPPHEDAHLGACGTTPSTRLRPRCTCKGTLGQWPPLHVGGPPYRKQRLAEYSGVGGREGRERQGKTCFYRRKCDAYKPNTVESLKPRSGGREPGAKRQNAWCPSIKAEKPDYLGRGSAGLRPALQALFGGCACTGPTTAMGAEQQPDKRGGGLRVAMMASKRAKTASVSDVALGGGTVAHLDACDSAGRDERHRKSIDWASLPDGKKMKAGEKIKEFEKTLLPAPNRLPPPAPRHESAIEQAEREDAELSALIDEIEMEAEESREQLVHVIVDKQETAIVEQEAAIAAMTPVPMTPRLERLHRAVDAAWNAQQRRCIVPLREAAAKVLRESPTPVYLLLLTTGASALLFWLSFALHMHVPWVPAPPAAPPMTPWMPPAPPAPPMPPAYPPNLPPRPPYRYPPATPTPTSRR